MLFKKITLKSLSAIIYQYFGERVTNYTLIIEDEDESAEISCDIFLGELPALLKPLGERYVYDFTVNNYEYELRVDLTPTEDE